MGNLFTYSNLNHTSKSKLTSTSLFEGCYLLQIQCLSVFLAINTHNAHLSPNLYYLDMSLQLYYLTYYYCLTFHIRHQYTLPNHIVNSFRVGAICDLTLYLSVHQTCPTHGDNPLMTLNIILKNICMHIFITKYKNKCAWLIKAHMLYNPILLSRVA